MASDFTEHYVASRTSVVPYTDYEDQLHQRVIDNGLETMKMRAEQKMQDWKMPHQNYRNGKCDIWKCGTRQSKGRSTRLYVIRLVLLSSASSFCRNWDGMTLWYWRNVMAGTHCPFSGAANIAREHRRHLWTRVNTARVILVTNMSWTRVSFLTLVFTGRVHGPWTRVFKMTPAFTGREHG